MKFRTHERLAELSKKLYSDSKDLNTGYKICWDNSSMLAEAIATDIKMITNTECFVTSIKFILGVSSYRQSANGCFLEVKFDLEDEFTLSLECLIDFGKVLLQVKQRPSDLKFNNLSNLVEARYEIEHKADLNNF